MMQKLHIIENLLVSYALILTSMENNFQRASLPRSGQILIKVMKRPTPSSHNIQYHNVFKQRQSVICDDTGVFILLHFYVSCKCANVLNMSSWSSAVANRSIVDLRATGKKHGDIAMSLPAANALTGTVAVETMFSVGKG